MFEGQQLLTLQFCQGQRPPIGIQKFHLENSWREHFNNRADLASYQVFIGPIPQQRDYIQQFKRCPLHKTL